MYQLILLILLTTNDKLEMHQINLESFYTLTECQGFQIAIENRVVLEINSNTTRAAAMFECVREV